MRLFRMFYEALLYKKNASMKWNTSKRTDGKRICITERSGHRTSKRARAPSNFFFFFFPRELLRNSFHLSCLGSTMLSLSFSVCAAISLSRHTIFARSLITVASDYDVWYNRENIKNENRPIKMLGKIYLTSRKKHKWDG